MVLRSVKPPLLSLFLYHSWNPIWVNQYEKTIDILENFIMFRSTTGNIKTWIHVFLLVYNEWIKSFQEKKKCERRAMLRFNVGQHGIREQGSDWLTRWVYYEHTDYNCFKRKKKRDFQANTLFDQHFRRHWQDKIREQNMLILILEKKKNSSAGKVFIYLFF